jgi:pilus assembly protein Flp/PilA
MLNYFQKLIHGRNRRNEDGASAVEYGLLVAAIAAVIVIAVFAIGKVVNGAFTSTCTAISNHPASNTATCS